MFILQRLISFLIPFHSHAPCSGDSLMVPYFRIQLTHENKSQSAKGFATEEDYWELLQFHFCAAPRWDNKIEWMQIMILSFL